MIQRDHNQDKKHTERCVECKYTVFQILRKIYGKVDANYKLNVGVLPDDYKKNQYYMDILNIYKSLQDYRGHQLFIKSKTLPRCDFFIHEPGFILEFDESQHFTIPRKISLEQYPQNMSSGFNTRKWIELSNEINAKDNNPIYRDEQRAWYDSLRDLLPLVLGLEPTVRIIAKDFKWCSLNPDNPLDIERFKEILGNIPTAKRTVDTGDINMGKISANDELVSKLRGDRRERMTSICIPLPDKDQTNLIDLSGKIGTKKTELARMAIRFALYHPDFPETVKRAIE